ncbi:MAG: 50S ribosomal protein L23 [Mycoplasmataceae bacterium]|jgi:large subunit ribosomal protein L23|nr:50S ribosomal protein L23 [Mycoplasmataceae bacterium]
MEFTRIILKPHQTEKSYALQNGAVIKYSFVVDPQATKGQIALAFHTIYGKKPAKVATKMCKSVATKTGTAHPGYTKKTKIAYITLPKGVTIGEAKNPDDTVAQAQKVQPVDVTKKEVTPVKTVEVKSNDATKKEVTPTSTDSNDGSQGGNI